MHPSPSAPGLSGPSACRPVDVELWLAACADVRRDRVDACLAALAPDERERAARFVIDDARSQFVLARTLLRRVLSHATGELPGAWVFERNRHGKPHIASPRPAARPHTGIASAAGLRFSVSHTPGLVAVALSRTSELGVDVECTTRELDFASVASALFSPAERARFDRLSAPDSRAYFFTIWTLKEAYVKARGLGLALPLDAFTFDLGTNSVRVAFSSRCPDVPHRWQFVCLEPDATHRLALAVPAATMPTWALRRVAASRLADALVAI